MRKLFYLALVIGLIWAGVRYIPAETKGQALAALGLSDFFSRKMPNFLRQKLSIPENPVTKRKKLLDELSQRVGDVERELEIAVPVATNGEVPPLPKTAEVRNRVENAREFLAQSEGILQKLDETNPELGIFQKTAERVLNKILPPPAAGEGGLGGDASGAECICP
ncbi:MAG: hypothetical protein AAB650_00805 [Patescibacteria group bacterium]